MKKYFVVGGWITSKSDGQEHYIGHLKLMELYGVNRDDCDFEGIGNRKAKDGQIVLVPRYDGDYSLPKPL